MFRLRVSVLLSLAASSAINISEAAAATRAGNKTAASAASFLVAGSGAVRSASGGSSNNPIIVHAEESGTGKVTMVDKEYPGTAVERMLAVRNRVKELTTDDLNQEWEYVRKKLLWAGGLKNA